MVERRRREARGLVARRAGPEVPVGVVTLLLVTALADLCRTSEHALVGVTLDAAHRLVLAVDGEDVVHLGLGEIVDGLVGRDTVLVEPAELGVATENHNVVAEHGEPVRAGQPGRAATNNCHTFPGRRSTLE